MQGKPVAEQEIASSFCWKQLHMPNHRMPPKNAVALFRRGVYGGKLWKL